MKNRKKIFCISMIMMMLVGLCSCGESIILKKSDEPYYVLKLGENKVSLADVKTIMLENKHVYNQYQGEIDAEIDWEETNEAGITYEEQLLYDYVLDELVVLELLQILAFENNIVLTEQEEQKILEASNVYMKQLSDSAKKYCYATLEQAQSLMKKYKIAENVIEFLTSDKDWEISENEARTITVQIMNLSTKELANNALDKLNQGSSFQEVYINLLGESPKDYTIVRGDLIPSIEEKVYLLKTGEYSDIVEYTDSQTGKTEYFIAYCANDYLPDLTEMNRLEIQNRKKMEYWMAIVEEKRDELQLYLDEKKLEKEDFSYQDLNASFYDIYNQYCDK